MREMKDSGIEWVGQIPENWEVNRNKYLFTNAKGLSITKENLIEEGLPVVSYGQIHSKVNNGVNVKDSLLRYVDYRYQEYYPQCQVNKYDFVFADTSEDYDGCGNCVYKRDESLLFAGYHTIILKSLKSTDKRYFAYLFKTDCWRKQVRASASGVKVFSITQRNLMNCQVIVPTMKEQQAIADFLDDQCGEIDSLVADIEKSIGLLEEYKKSVITEAVTKGLDPDVEMKDSGIEWIGQIPKHWMPVNPKSLFSLRTQKILPGDEQLTASQKYGVISQKRFMELENQRIVTVDKDFGILKHVEPNDFIISMRSFQGGLEYSTVRGCISSAYVMLIPNCNKVYAPYYKWLFKSSSYINALQSTSNLVRDGQAMRYSNFVKVRLFEVPMIEQQQIADYLDAKCSEIDALVADKKKQLELLKEYKRSLIYEYVTGKKEVPVA